MRRSRRTIVVVALAVTVASVAVAVLGWGPGGVETASWVASIFSLTVATVALLGGGVGTQADSSPEGGYAAGRGPDRRTAMPTPRRWNPSPTRSGAGAVLVLGGLGAALVVVLVLGAAMIIFR
ncbi:hypothetical protein [Micromonospora sp. KC721]|uniref:hypothetical protein n=1 Tax=Micromonospora sp. KC721 TaxID=2530380 RepID=UPI0010443CFE|nr:hypothetical protein [Micromonospora sp. KC721]TDB73873.1 hypothetical protein E1182_20205 [Micromonospora sp. KC721]